MLAIRLKESSNGREAIPAEGADPRLLTSVTNSQTSLPASACFGPAGGVTALPFS